MLTMINRITMNIADKVESALDKGDSIVGTFNVPGVGRATVWTDERARDVYEDIVAPLEDKGSFQTETSMGEPVRIVWGRR